MGFRLADREWPLADRVPGGLGYKIAQAESDSDHARAMGLALRMAKLLIAEGDARADFEAFVDSDDFDLLDYEEIAEAIAGAMEEVTQRPTKRSSPSALGQSVTTASSKGASSSPDTVPLFAPRERYRFGLSAAS